MEAGGCGAVETVLTTCGSFAGGRTRKRGGGGGLASNVGPRETFFFEDVNY